MPSPRMLRLALAGTFFCAATPALASDFSGLIYFFAAVIAVVGLIAFALVFAFRKIVATGGLLVDAMSGAVIAAALAPAGYIDQFGQTVFVWFPGWTMLVFDIEWTELLPSYPISLAIVAGLVFGFLRLLASRRAEQNVEDAG